MLSLNQIQARLADYLAGRESIDSLEDWLAPESFASIRQDSEPELRNIVASVLHLIDLYSDNYIDELSLRNELYSLIEPSNVQEYEVQFSFQGFGQQPASAKPQLKPSLNSLVEFGQASFAL